MNDNVLNTIEELKNLVKKRLNDQLNVAQFRRHVKAITTLLTIRAHLRAQKTDPEQNKYFVTALKQAEVSMSKMTHDKVNEKTILSMCRSIENMYEEMRKTGQIREEPIMMQEVSQVVSGDITIDDFCKAC